MTNLNSNSHADDAQRLISVDNAWQGVGYETADAQHIVGHIEANTQATLALAYEQRTSALIAFYATIPGNASDESYRNLYKTIITRLGLNDGGAA
jgi:hypothetical protein